MNIVEPIKDRKLVKKMIDELASRSERDALLAKLGFYTNLRISDILQLQAKHFYTEGGKPSTYIRLNEQKTKKSKLVRINNELKRGVYPYIHDYEIKMDEYLIFSIKYPERPITRQAAWLILKNAAKRCGIEKFGPHSMRKTFGWFVYSETKDLLLVMNLLNHSDPRVTRRYIGLDQEDMDRAYMAISF